MAESILSDVAAGIISNLASLVLKEIGLWWGLKDELHKLEETVTTIQAVLLDAEERSLLDGEENRQVKVWLGKLSEAMYDADDLLDEFPTEAELRQAGSKMSKKVCRIFSSYKMAHKVKSCRERLDEIAALRKFHLDERRVERSVLSRETHSSPPQVVIGREHDKEKIVDCLLSSSDDDKENVSVVSILGIGGLGKTTLAQMVFDDDTVKNHFELEMWVCVSLDFDVQKLVEKVLGQPPQN